MEVTPQQRFDRVQKMRHAYVLGVYLKHGGNYAWTTHAAATAGLVGDGIREAESATTAAEAWWSRRAELSP